MTYEKMMDFKGAQLPCVVGQCHGVVFTDRSIFKYILENFFSDEKGCFALSMSAFEV